MRVDDLCKESLHPDTGILPTYMQLFRSLLLLLCNSSYRINHVISKDKKSADFIIHTTDSHFIRLLKELRDYFNGTIPMNTKRLFSDRINWILTAYGIAVCEPSANGSSAEDDSENEIPMYSLLYEDEE